MSAKWIVGLVALCLILGTGRAGKAEEQTGAFLAALQQRGYHDVAIAYLGRMATSELASAEFRAVLDYHRGMVLVHAARQVKHPGLRQERLDAAEAALTSFVQAQPQHPLAALARSQQGNVLVERARAAMLRVKSGAPDSDAIQEQALVIFQQAYESLAQSRDDLKLQLTAGGTNSSDATQPQEEIESLRTQYVQTYLALGRVLFEHAQAIGSDGPGYREKLNSAATVFDEVAQKYRNWSAGMYALMYEGECYHLLGEDTRALSYFKELLQNNDNSPIVRRLKTKALALSIACWLAADQESGHEMAISAGQQWLTTVHGNEENDASWLELKLALARAFLQKSQQDQNEKQASRALADARELAEELARRRSPIQEEAQQLLVSMGRRTPEEQAEVVAPPDDSPATFVAARDAAQRVLDEVKVASASVKILGSQRDSVNDPTRRAEMDARLQESQERVTELTIKALGLFEQAAKLATDPASEDLQSVRYFLSYLYYSQADYRRAAVLAGFVAIKYPDSVAARECANVALAARQHLYQEASEAERDVQVQRISEVAELMIAKWPGQSQAATALTTLLDLTMESGDLQKAEAYLQQIPTDSPRRTNAELRTGQAVWREYLKGVMAADSGDATSSVQELDHLKLRAQQILAQGLSRVGDASPDESTVRAALSLAQIYVDSGQAAEALQLLNNETFGALTLVSDQGTWTKRIPGLMVETYKVALRAQIAAAASASDTRGAIAAAQQMLGELKRELGDGPQGREQMITIYVGLARDLERQLSIASPTARKELSAGFEAFLGSAAADTDDPSVLNWVAETFYSLGRGSQKDETSTESDRYFRLALDSYAKLYALLRTQPSALSPEAALQARVRYAMVLREVGKYEQSVKLFVEILQERNMILDIQVEAAVTLQRWGGAGDTQALNRAIMGDVHGGNGRNVIWGWGRIASVVGKPAVLAKGQSYRDTFHRARYNIALCRYELALTSRDQKQELLARAKQDIVATKRAFGLGSPQSIQRYEQLLKKIQKSLGEDPIGFSEKS